MGDVVFKQEGCSRMGNEVETDGKGPNLRLRFRTNNHGASSYYDIEKMEAILNQV